MYVLTQTSWKLPHAVCRELGHLTQGWVFAVHISIVQSKHSKIVPPWDEVLLSAFDSVWLSTVPEWAAKRDWYPCQPLPLLAQSVCTKPVGAWGGGIRRPCELVYYQKDLQFCGWLAVCTNRFSFCVSIQQFATQLQVTPQKGNMGTFKAHHV